MNPDPKQPAPPADDPTERDRLRAGFVELRRADDRRAPSFEQTCRAAARLARGSRAAGDRRRASRAAVGVASRGAVPATAAVALLGVVGIAGALFTARPAADRTAGLQRPTATAPAAGHMGPTSGPAVSLADWRSPTAWLLDPAPADPPPAGRAGWPAGLNF